MDGTKTTATPTKKRSGSKSKASLRRVRAVEYILHKLLMASVSSSAAAANLVFSKHTRRIVGWKKTKKNLQKKKNGMVSRSTTNWFIRISVIVDYTLHECICQQLQTAFSNQEYVLPAKKRIHVHPYWNHLGPHRDRFQHVGSGQASRKRTDGMSRRYRKNWYTKHSSTQYPLPILESY